ncbi:MAG: O-antigen ligase family protein [bacterium]|nr:O-antigen ligase family protein [bacterium]
MRPSDNSALGAFLLLTMLFLGIEALGFGTAMMRLQLTTPIGDYRVVHVVLLIVLIVSFLDARRVSSERQNPLFMPMLALYLLIGVRVFVDYVVVLLFQTYPLSELLGNALGLFPYLYLLPMVFLMRRRQSAAYFVRGILLLGFVVGALVMYQYMMGAAFVASKWVVYETGRIRMIQPGIHLTAWSGYTMLAMSLGSRRGTLFLGLSASVLLAMFMLQLHRSALVALAVGTLLVFLSKMSRRRDAIMRMLVTALVLSSVAAGLVFGVKPLQTALSLEIASIADEVAYWTGSLAFRFLLVQNAWDHVVDRNVLLGRGFHWIPFQDFEVFRLTGVTLGPTSDSAVANILLVFGVPGLVIYAVVFSAVFLSGVRLLRRGLSVRWDAVVTGILAFNATAVILLWFSDPIMGSPDTWILVASWGLLWVALNLRRKGEIGG